jgi:hypothetical protein
VQQVLVGVKVLLLHPFEIEKINKKKYIYVKKHIIGWCGRLVWLIAVTGAVDWW